MPVFRVYYDPDQTEELWRRSPYNLRRDLKGISESELCRIAQEIGDELRNGAFDRPSAAWLYWGGQRKAAYAKIRVVDVSRSKGKSSGYRCIVLVDFVNNSAYMLHLYRHGHGENDNITKSDSNKLKGLVDEYIDSLLMNNG